MRYLACVLFLIPLALKAQDKKEPISINNADYLEYNRNYANAERLIGNVSMSQGNMTLTCDSAWFWKDENRLEAFGHAFLNQAGTMMVWSDYMRYDGNTKMASAERNVKMSDNKMTLTTSAIQYDVTDKTAYYSNGGNIRDGENTMTSKKGRYHSETREYDFRDDIRLVNPEYTMDSDTLHYNGNNKTAYFFGPTFIRSTDNLLFCNYGWYDTRNNTCQFSKKAYILSKENRIDSDSFLYNRNTGIGWAFGNITLTDTLQKIVIQGQKGIHNRFLKSTLISGNPVAFKKTEDDTVFIQAVNFYDKLDTVQKKRTLAAYGSARVFKSDFQGTGDSISYSLSDSCIRFFDDPVLWNEKNQTTGDTIFIFQKGKSLDRMDVLQNAMVVIREDEDKYSQVKGKKLYARFSENKLYRVSVKGSGQSVYYVREDSVKYTGVNYIECTNLLVSVTNNRVQKVRCLVKPEGTFYPLDQFPPEKAKLRGFRWLAEKRPVRSDFAIRH